MAKIRIQTIDPKTNLPTKDRLTEFAGEMYLGPTEKHEGPIRVEVLLEDKEQVTQFIEYLRKLALDLPVSERAKRSYTPKTVELTQDTAAAITDQAISKKTQDDMVKHLRELNFVFVSYEHYKSICDKNGWELTLKKESHEEWQYMVRMLRLAKDPKNDKIDPTLSFAIKLVGTRFNFFHIYISGKYSKTVKKDWENLKEVNFKIKEKFYKFPEGMLYDERAKWRAEDRKIAGDPKLEKTPFYTRWEPYITRLKPLPVKKK